jgi:hypothetical protein
VEQIEGLRPEVDLFVRAEELARVLVEEEVTEPQAHRTWNFLASC